MRLHTSNRFVAAFAGIRQLLKTAFLIVSLILLLPALCFGKGKPEPPKPYGGYQLPWSLSYSVTEGAIVIDVMVYDRTHYLSQSGYVDDSKLEFTKDNGKTWVPFYRLDYNYGPQKDPGTGPIGTFGATATFRNNGDPDYATVRLPIPTELIGITKIRFWGKFYRKADGIQTDFDETKAVTVVSMSPINPPTMEFVTVPQGNSYVATARVSYTKAALNSADRNSSIAPYSTDNSWSDWSNPTQTSGSSDVPLSNMERKIYWMQSHSWVPTQTVRSTEITIPAFTLPKEAIASYDAIKHAAILWWSMDPVTSTTNYVNDSFKLQVADNPDFISAKEVHIKYDPTQDFFTYEVNKDLSPNLYFRVARDRPGFKWELAKKANIAVSFTPLVQKYASVVLQPDNTVFIKWQVAPSAWLPGSTFIIRRKNIITGVTEDVNRLNEDGFNKGVYIDQTIPNCNVYEYSLQVQPLTNTGFTAFDPITLPNTIKLTQVGTVTNLVASKGYFPGRTELAWRAIGTFDRFLVKRAPYGTNNFTQIASVPGGSTGDFSYDDEKGSPGSYYTYMVVGAVKCVEEKFSKDTIYAVGFRSPTGNVYGRITYENGQAVSDVAVRLQSKDLAQFGQSILLNGDANSYLKLDSLNVPFVDSAFTVETWIRPTDNAPANQVLFSRGGQYELGFDNGGKLYFTYNKTATVAGTYSNPTRSFVHVTAIHRKDSMFLLLNEAVIAKAAVPYAASTPDRTVFIGRKAAGNNYKGLLDEMLVWNVALDSATNARNYTRLLTGNEPGLAAYWRFDETMKDQFYDASWQDETYNKNNGRMDSTQVQRSKVTPSIEQLGLKAYTDVSGNYLVTGVPYSGNGTTYSIAPLLGTHQFDPVTVNRLLSSASQQFTVDFKDKSSFNVTGTVYYKNSTVPVAGVRFKIDGTLLQQTNGTFVETDASGRFVLSVPVGVHDVQAVKDNHVFVNDGKITDSLGNNLNYQNHRAGVELNDSTTIRFIGRVAGGSVQEALPLGHSVSVNNLGKQLTLTLKLPTGNTYSLYTGTPAKTITQLHLLPSNRTDSAKINKTRIVYQANQILIYPDSLSGEFVADLIPEKFLANSVDATGWGDLLEGKPTTLDFTQKFVLQNSVREYIDSVQDSKGTWLKTEYNDTVRYNASYQFIKRTLPTVTINQADFNKKPLPYFGDTTYTSTNFLGASEPIGVFDPAKTGKDAYLFGRPVFIKGLEYTFLIKAFEAYPFYESVNSNGVPVVAQKNGKDRIDQVPTQDGFVSLYNNLTGIVTADTLSLDPAGQGIYTFSVGEPDFASRGVKNFSANIRFGQATNVSWQWLGEPMMGALVLGYKSTGTNFVTAGPNEMIMVLRDPPGSKSYAYAEKGWVKTTVKKYTGSFRVGSDLEWTTKVGSRVSVFNGAMAAPAGPITGNITEGEVSTGKKISLQLESHITGSRTSETTTTGLTAFKTSEEPDFVGPGGDVFVGYSTNITYGQTNNLTIVKRSQLLASDSLVYDPSPTGAYLLVQRLGIDIGQRFGTLFAYPQQYIQDVLIPSLIQIRNNNLLPSTVTAAEAQQRANASSKILYVSKLSVTDPNFGKSNNDTAFKGTIPNAPFGDGPSYTIYLPAKSNYSTDTIMILNQYVANWQKRMADNEEAKLKAKFEQNYSFHSGSPIEYFRETNDKSEDEQEFNFVVSPSVSDLTSEKLNAKGYDFSYTVTSATEQGGTFNQGNENSTKFGFVLASGGTDDYFSVDVLQPDDGAFAFRTKGGASSCPYEGQDVTKYYEPGKHVLNQPTLRNEVPVMSVDNAVANNVPSTRKAYYTLSLKNESEAKLGSTFILSYVNNDSIKGATIAVDGLSIANGRAIPIQFGETIEKVLTIEKGPAAMDYNNIMVVWHSACQYDPTGSRENIGDTVLLSAHFIPSCSDINIKFPKDKWVLNTESPVNQQGKRYLPVTIDQFDVNNKLFDHIELQYKSSATSTWITAMKFYADSSKLKAAQGEKLFITNPAAINYNLVMDDAAFNDQRYDVQAVGYCNLGGANFITTESNLITGIKDTYSPRLFGSPQPANGILTANDDVRLNFNETIAEGLLTPANFQVTGIRNGAVTSHGVSVRLDGASNYLATEFDKSFTGKNITAEMWVLPTGVANQTIFSHGDATESLELALTSDQKMQVTVGSKVIKSTASYNYKPGEWAHVALVYNDASKTVSAYYNFETLINAAPVNAYGGTGHIEYGRSAKAATSYFNGKIHEARIWNDTLNSLKLQVNSLKVLSGAENALLAYYPMNEGKGNVILDKAHGSNAALNGLWTTPAGKAVNLTDTGYVKVNTALAPVTSAMDYTLELWFKGDASQSDATLASNGKGDGTDPSGATNLFSLGFEAGVLTFRNNGFKVPADGTYLDNKWHHVAVAVNRNSGSGQLLVDGQLNQFFDAQNLGGIAAANTYLGARSYYTTANAATPQFDRYFKGYIDEFRIWNTYLSQSFITKNNNVRLQGNELGLLAYYPFETYITFQGVTQLYYSLKDAKVQEVSSAVVPDAVLVNAAASDEAAALKDRGPVENLRFDFVTNNDALIINLLEPKQAIDKSTITFKAKGIRDVNGNLMVSPVTWTAYIDQNQLKWSDKEINLVKTVGDPLTFTSYLVNSGGNSQHYAVYNLPAWLKASPSTGSVDPAGNQKIQFTVNAGLNIGSYEEIIFMRNDNNETEALKVTLQVKGKKPDWVVKTSDYEYNMVVYGKLRLNNIFSINKEDMLGAFINGKCVGVATNTYNASNKLWYTFLTVYNNEATAANIEFRIWQASTGKTFIATPSKAIIFANNAVNGTASVPVIFDGSSSVYQSFTINQNWNWISFNLFIPANTPLGTTLQNGTWTVDDLIKNEDLKKGFANYTANQGWKGSLNSLDNLSLYKMKVAVAQSLPVSGTPVNVKTTPIPLKGAQWNYISYLPQFNATLKDALAGYGAADEDVIKSQTGFAMYSAQNGWVGSLTYLEPGKGYMMYRKRATDTSFYYPAIPGSLVGGRTARGNRAPDADQRPVPGNFSHSDNMTIIAVVAPGFDFRSGDSIIAYVNGEVRGKAAPIQNPEINKNTWFFNIGGETEQSLIFVVEREGHVIAQSSTVMKYSNNTVLGTLAKPLELQFMKNAELLTVNPNPFKYTTTIRVDVSGLTGATNSEIQLSVFDVLGRKVWGTPLQRVTGTMFSTTWNGKSTVGTLCSNGVYFVQVMVNGVPHLQKVMKQ